MVTVTKGERKSAEGTKGESGTENVNRQRRKSHERDGENGNVERSGKSARERTRGDDFRERGLRGPPRRGAESPSSPGAAARIFLPLSGPLSRPLFFFPAGPPSRRARCFSSPVDRVDFSFRASAQPRPHATMAACPKIRRWGGALSRDPRVFFANSPRARTPSSPALPRSPSLSYALFSLPFFLSQLPLRLHLPPTSTSIRPSSSLACSLYSSASPPGVYFKRSLEPALPPSPSLSRRYSAIRSFGAIYDT